MSSLDVFFMRRQKANDRTWREPDGSAQTLMTGCVAPHKHTASISVLQEHFTVTVARVCRAFKWLTSWATSLLLCVLLTYGSSQLILINDGWAQKETCSDSISAGFMDIVGLKKISCAFETISEFVSNNSVLVTICLYQIHNYDLFSTVMQKQSKAVCRAKKQQSLTRADYSQTQDHAVCPLSLRAVFSRNCAEWSAARGQSQLSGCPAELGADRPPAPSALQSHVHCPLSHLRTPPGNTGFQGERLAVIAGHGVRFTAWRDAW